MREGCELLQAHKHHIVDLAASARTGQQVEDAAAAQQHTPHAVGGRQERLPSLRVQGLVPGVI